MKDTCKKITYKQAEKIQPILSTYPIETGTPRYSSWYRYNRQQPKTKMKFFHSKWFAWRLYCVKPVINDNYTLSIPSHKCFTNQDLATEM